MRRRISAAAALSLTIPATASAGQTMPQMDFHNPLTLDQVWWMAVILIVLYFTLSRWGLPQIGKVLAHRDAVISADLEAARAAKVQADATVAALNRTMKDARGSAQAEIAQAVHEAKTKARDAAQAQQEALDAELEKSEAEITAARSKALAAIKPVAADTATEILSRLTGITPDAATLTPEIDRAYAASQAA
jgi:F-type H+-transporting ATPase subunit b